MENARASRRDDRRRSIGSDMVDFFSGDRRGIDRETGMEVVKLYSGDYYVTQDTNEKLGTILGSCVAACIRDPFLGIGGMNHFLLPGDTTASNPIDGSTRYGVNAMETLINAVMKLGGRKDRLEVKVFGGGNVTGNSVMIGSKNAAFVREFLKNEGLEIKAADLEGPYPRRVIYTPSTGKVMMRQLKRDSDKVVVQQEKVYEKSLRAQPTAGDIELF